MSFDAFAKVAGASATGGGNNIRDGVYEMMVEKVHMQSGHTGQCFIAEFRVLSASSNGAVDEKGHPVVPNAPGSTCSLVCNLTKFENAAGNAKAFVANALAGLGVTEDKITPEVLGWVCSESNPLRGLRVTDETYRTVNKGRSNPANAGKSLTLNKWKPIAQSKEIVEQQRAWLDKTPPKVDTAAQPSAAAALPAGFGGQAQPTAPAPAPTPQTQPTAAPAASPPTGLGGILPGFLK
jgi:hypothetical protein